jgi:hypothetical protein
MDCVQREQSRRGAARRVVRCAALTLILGGSAGCLDGLVTARNAGNEASAIASLRTILAAQAVTSMDCSGRYAPSLTALAATGNLPPDLGAADAVEKAGYRITMTVPTDAVPHANDQTPACNGRVTAFTATAVPLEPGQTGSRFFIVDQSGELEQATSASFTDATPVR